MTTESTSLPTTPGWYLATHRSQRDPEWPETQTHVHVVEDCGEITVEGELNGSDRLEAWIWGVNIDEELSELASMRSVLASADVGQNADGIVAVLEQRKLLEESLQIALGERDTPETTDFLRGVALEADHQVARWGAEHDAGKQPQDWFWLLGYLSGKALSAALSGDQEKAAHHTVSSAAMLLNWHRAITGHPTAMRPGIEEPRAESEVSSFVPTQGARILLPSGRIGTLVKPRLPSQSFDPTEPAKPSWWVDCDGGITLFPIDEMRPAGELKSALTQDERAELESLRSRVAIDNANFSHGFNPDVIAFGEEIIASMRPYDPSHHSALGDAYAAARRAHYRQTEWTEHFMSEDEFRADQIRKAARCELKLPAEPRDCRHDSDADLVTAPAKPPKPLTIAWFASTAATGMRTRADELEGTGEHTASTELHAAAYEIIRFARDGISASERRLDSLGARVGVIELSKLDIEDDAAWPLERGSWIRCFYTWSITVETQDGDCVNFHSNRGIVERDGDLALSEHDTVLLHARNIFGQQRRDSEADEAFAAYDDHEDAQLRAAIANPTATFVVHVRRRRDEVAHTIVSAIGEDAESIVDDWSFDADEFFDGGCAPKVPDDLGWWIFEGEIYWDQGDDPDRHARGRWRRLTLVEQANLLQLAVETK